MRTSILALAAVLMVAGCGDNTPVKLDSGTKHDMSMMQTSHDMAMSTQITTCPDLFNCLINAGSNTTQQTKCVNSATKHAQDLLNAFLTCRDNVCGQDGTGAPDAGANDPCKGPPDANMVLPCYVCATTGTSSTGMKDTSMGGSNGTCYSSATNTAFTNPVTSTPLPSECGACLDQTLGCFNDTGM